MKAIIHLENGVGRTAHNNGIDSLVESILFHQSMYGVLFATFILMWFYKHESILPRFVSADAGRMGSTFSIDSCMNVSKCFKDCDEMIRLNLLHGKGYSMTPESPE